MTKDQMLADLSFDTKVLLWSGVIFGALAVGILGFSVARYSRFTNNYTLPILTSHL